MHQKHQACEKITHRMENIFANHMSDKDLIFKIYKELI